jgi:cytochrome c553
MMRGDAACPDRAVVRTLKAWPAVAAVAVAIAACTGAAATDIELGRYLATECMTCHRAAGGAIPPLAMAEAIMVAKLEAYRDKRLPNPTMQTIAGRLTDAEIAALARYFATVAKP